VKLKDIDTDEFLAEVDALAEEAGDWRQHLPYEAEVEYRTNAAVQFKYSKHADSCWYCQELIELFGD